LFGFTINRANASLHFNLKPANQSLAYLLVFKLNSYPVINVTTQAFDSFKIVCPSSI
jgi:hypothetical protein